MLYNQGIGDKITSAIRFAKDCVDDRKYREANSIYKNLWEMVINTDSEYDDPVDLELLISEELVHTNFEKTKMTDIVHRISGNGAGQTWGSHLYVFFKLFILKAVY